MKATERHADEDSLIACYLAGNGLKDATSQDEQHVAHLAACPACAERYRALSASLLGAKEALEREADEYFTDARLAHQQERILRHVQGSDVNARILPFPVSPSVRTHLVWPRLATRWIAGAAAAGLFVGLAAGLMMEARYHRGFTWRTPKALVALTSPPRGVSLAGTLLSDAADERFLSEIDEALSSQRAAELQPFDALTPHVQEIVANLR